MVIEEHPVRQKVPVVMASLGARFVHIIIDNIVLQVITSGVTYLMVTANPTDVSLEFVAIFLNLGLIFCYYAVMESVFQQTVGKMVTGAVVVDEYGQKITFGTAALRTIIRVVPFDALSFLFSVRGWHDRWARTYVMNKQVLQKRLQALQNEEEAAYDALILQ